MGGHGDAVGAVLGAEVHLRIDDKWLVDYASSQNAYVDCRHLDGTRDGRVMRPSTIMIGTTGNVKGVLWGENHNQADVYALTANTLYQLAFKFIYADGTTARGIKIFC